MPAETTEAREAQLLRELANLYQRAAEREAWRDPVQYVAAAPEAAA